VGAWASDLSAVGLAVVGSVGFDPVGQVLGVSVYQVGYTGAYCSSGFRPTSGSAGTTAGPLVTSLYTARRKALDRMKAEATALGADGVLGLDLMGANTELPKYTQALYAARELAMERMQTEAEALGAEGIVGVQLRNHAHIWGGHTTEFFAIGTAVTPLREDHVITKPTMVLGLD
jgi:uncharacterized protein YbjQ (UPF0145 family)